MKRDWTAAELAGVLALEDFEPIYRMADQVRRDNVGDVVHIRAILEFSNVCRRRCAYCGLNAGNATAHRYRMTPQEMVDSAQAASAAGYRTLVLQSGEDAAYTPEILGEVVRQVKRLGMAVTLSCGEMERDAYAYLKDCGADRYLLKHETADPQLYRKLHPCGTLENRVRCLYELKSLGYEVGGGFMVGLPGQTLDTLAKDLLLLKEIGCHMAGVGPFIAHPATPLAGSPSGDTELTQRAVALCRLLLPEANLPATTSLGVADGPSKARVFSRGANVVMRKVTPDPYKAMYEIYPARLDQTNVAAQRKELEEQILKLGRRPL